jgi:gamma-glutamyltranspeptidase/glutathione hydrolase
MSPVLRTFRWLFVILLSSPVLAVSPDGVVAVSHPAAAAAGAHMLAQGGNAIDAAAAVQFALNVVEPQSSGIGGGGFMLIHLAKTGETVIVDSRERAPAAASADMFAKGMPMPFQQASTSGLSVGVPGTLRGVDTALRRWNTLPLSRTLEPAIELAEHGFRVNRFLAEDIANDGGRTQLQPETAAIFRPGGVPLKEGDWLVQPDLANTLKLLAAEGPDVFYRGPLAQAIVNAQRRSRSELGSAGVGRMTLADLLQYQVAIRQPLVGHYRGWTLAGMPPPSSGGLTTMQMLTMLERFPLGDAARGYGFGSPRTLHVMIEAMRLAFADRALWIGADDAMPVPQAGLLNADYLATRSAMISPESRMDTPDAGNPLPWGTLSARPKPLPTDRKVPTPRTLPSSTAGATWSATRAPSNTPGARASPCRAMDSCSTTN